MAQQHTLGSHATTVTRKEGNLSIIYHSTEVVRETADKIILNTGGYFSNTTKTRMNQASSQFDLGFNVYQKKKKWYVNYLNKTHPFCCEVVELDKVTGECLNDL